MTLPAVILFPLLGGLLAWAAGVRNAASARRISLVAAVLQCVLVAALALRLQLMPMADAASPWLAEWRMPWIPQIGASLHFAADGLTMILLLLTAFLGFVAVLISEDAFDHRGGAFQLCLLSAVAAVSGVFLAVDLLLFFVFFEAMLVPVYFLILLWGDLREDRFGAALKFFLFTQAGGLLMLFAILSLSFFKMSLTGQTTMDAMELGDVRVMGLAAWTLPLGFFLAFAVKLPMVPLHSWQPVTYATVPASGGIILSGVMAKVGAYGMLRFLLPLFPEVSGRIAPWAMGLALIGILYGALAAFAQTDLRRFIAWSSVNHLGFVVLGIFSMNGMGQRGAVVLMVAHGCSVAGLFVLSSLIERNGGSRDMSRLGGLWSSSPRLGAFAMLLMMATLGLPGLANFVGEFLVLLGTFHAQPCIAVPAAIATVLSAAYALRLMQWVFFGAHGEPGPVPDLSGRHGIAAVMLVLALLGFGLFPNPLLKAAGGGWLRGGPNSRAFSIQLHWTGSDGTAANNASGHGGTP
jgi:NADH-quinone oxidoreductase subunit M